MARYGCTGRIGSTRVAKLSELYLLWTCHGSFTGSSAMRSQRSQEARALSSPSHSSCACVNVWGRLKSLVLQLSRSSAVFPRQADHINWLSCLGKKELGGGGGICVYSILSVFIFFLCSHEFLFWFPSCFDLSSTPAPSGLCATSSSCSLASDMKEIWGLPTLYHSPALCRHSFPKNYVPLTYAAWLRL